RARQARALRRFAGEAKEYGYAGINAIRTRATRCSGLAGVRDRVLSPPRGQRRSSSPPFCRYLGFCPSICLPKLLLTLKEKPIVFVGILVGLGRLELPTSPLSGVRSSHLSYRPNERHFIISESMSLATRHSDPCCA